MTSPLKRTQRRASTLTRSFADAIRSKLSNYMFPHSSKSCMQYNNPLKAIPIYEPAISHPRPIRHRRAHPRQHLHWIHRLPVEILSHIFVLGAEEDDMLPMRVSHVCATWRQVALRSPSLWRRISLDRRQLMWRERIHRARACSLDVQLRPWMTVWSGFPQHQTLDMYSIQWYMHLVTPHIHHWRSLSITFTDFGPYLWNAALSGCCSRTRAKAPLLTDLSLIYRTNDDTKEFSLFSGFAPNLRRVTLDGLRLTWLPSLFGNLSYLDYRHHNFTRGRQAINDILSMLEVSCRLVELRIMFPRKMAVPLRTPLPQTNRRVLLPILTHLHLRVEGTEIPFELAHLVYLISTPSLVSLRFVDVTRQHYPFPNLQSFFQQYRIPPSVRVLRIEHGWHDPRLVTSVLHNHPSVGYVPVRKPHMSDQIFLLVSRNRKGSRWTANAPTNERHGYVFPTLSLSRHARHPEYTSRSSRREHHWDL